MSGPRAKCDQVVFEAMAKASEVIVSSRCPHAGIASSISSRFNLQIPEIPRVRQTIHHVHLPLRLEIYGDANQLLERWSVEYRLQNSQPLYGDPIVQLRHVCKKIVIWLRSLYCSTRLLPCHKLRGSSLRYNLTVFDDSSEVPSFAFTTAPSLSTSYGILAWKVWYSPRVPKLTSTLPIPIVTQITSPTSVGQEVHSAPTRGKVFMQQQQMKHGSHERSSHLKAVMESSLRNETLLDHRAALHDPPSYHTQTTPPLSSSPFGAIPGNSGTPPLSSTPPIGFMSQTGPLIPPRTSAPPFQGLPTALSDAPDTASSSAQIIRKPTPTTTLDLLHMSPFKTNPSMTLSSLGESDYMRTSTMLAATVSASGTASTDCDYDDMPFAVDDERESPAALHSLAQKCATAHRLSILEGDGDDLASLSQQLQDFKAFGASLHQ